MSNKVYGIWPVKGNLGALRQHEANGIEEVFVHRDYATFTDDKGNVEEKACIWLFVRPFIADPEEGSELDGIVVSKYCYAFDNPTWRKLTAEFEEMEDFAAWAGQSNADHVSQDFLETEGSWNTVKMHIDDIREIVGNGVQFNNVDLPYQDRHGKFEGHWAEKLRKQKSKRKKLRVS